MGGIEPARTLILTAMRQRCLRRHRQQGAPGPGRPHPVRGSGQGRRAAVLRGRRGRRHPHPAAHPRQPVRRPDHPGARASSTAPPTSSWTRWTPPARSSPTRWPRPSAWATRKPTPRPTSKATTPPPRPRSSRRCPSTPRFALDDVSLRGHQLRHRGGHRRGQGRRLCHQAAGHRREAGGAGRHDEPASPCASTPRCCRASTRWPPSTVHSTPSSSRPRTPAS